MNPLTDLMYFMYVYCTDFILNLTDLSGMSYFEVNFIIFCVLYPLAVVMSLLLFVVQWIRWVAIRKSGLGGRGNQ